MMHANSAYKCFVENVELYGNAQTQPEKYNLYNGLANLAQAIKDLQDEVSRLRGEVDDLRRR